MHRRLVVALALFTALALPAHGYAPGSMPDQANGAPIPHVSCPASLTPSAAPLTIVAPVANQVVSTTISLRVADPGSTASSVWVCATYRYGTTIVQNVPVAPSLTYNGGSWSGAWALSDPNFVSQSGITLSFMGENGSAPFLIGTVQGITIDKKPPSSTASVGSPSYSAPGGSLYVAGGTQITLAASDPPLDDGSAGSGATVFYQIDGEPAQPYTAPFILVTLDHQRGDGAHTITYWSVDGAGNTEPAHTLSLTLDNTPPAITPLISGAFNSDGSAYTPVTVALTASDAGSGLKGIYYDVGPGPACPPVYPYANVCGQAYTPGQQITIATTGVLNYAAVDNVGNTAEYSLPITITTPTATPQPLATLPPTATPTPTGTAIPTTPPVAPTATRTPRPTPAWAPIDAPPLLKRTPPRLPTPAGNPPAPTPLHMHTLPPPHQGTPRHSPGKQHRRTVSKQHPRSKHGAALRNIS